MRSSTRTRISYSLAFALTAVFALPPIAGAAPAVVMQLYNKQHTGWNPHEKQLTVDNVKAGFQLLFTDSTDGQTYSQPLYLPRLRMRKLGVHNVIFVATENNTIYAFDADQAGPPLWSVNLTPNGETVQTASDYNNNRVPQIGITGTPVIDRSTHTLYAVAASKTLAMPTVFHQRLHAINVINGKERPNSPVDIQAKYPGTGGIQDGHGNEVFDPLVEFNRPALLLFRGKVYTAFGSHEDNGAYQGWVIAYNKKSLAQAGVFNTSPNLPPGVGGGSIWQSSIGLVADRNSVYFITGNGLFDVNDGGVDWGDTTVRLNLHFKVKDSFTPCNQQVLDDLDVDLGSGGVMILPDQPHSPRHLLTHAGKEGSIYLIDRKAMGGYNPSTTHDNVPCTDNVVQKLWRVLGVASTDSSARDAYWGSPVYFRDSGGHQYVYYSGTLSPIAEYDLANGALTAGTVAGGAPNITSSSFPNGGTIPSISSNGGDPSTAILWAIKRAPSAEGAGPLTLNAYAATDLTNQLVTDISAGSWDFNNYAFLIPTVVNGKVYVASGGELDVFGLTPPAPVSSRPRP
jgi:hypothetical protein